jgi:hypothetical protein
MDEPRAYTDSRDLSRPGLGGNHNLPLYNILCDTPWGLHPNHIFLKISKSRVLQFLKLGLLALWTPIIFCVDLRLRWGLKQKYSPYRELSNNIKHTSCTHVIRGDSWLLVVGNQIDILTPSPFFGHSLCCKYSNGSCEWILDIYIFKIFPWYKEVLNSMNFDLSSCFLNIWESNSQSGSWSLIPSHFPTFLGVWM